MKEEININSILADKYKILRLLGQGGMGIVWLAENIQTREYVALKVFKTDFKYKKLENLLLFRKEADILQGLDHPQIGRMIEFDFSGDDFFIAMEYIEGTTLQEYLEENNIFPLQDFMEIAIQLSNIFSYIHEQNILHSDIKPNNIILQKNKGRLIVKILDFGISLLLPIKLNAFYRSKGSCAYMSPEQSGFLKRKIDHRSDLYSLGILFYRMLAGRLPYEGENIYQLMHKHIASEPDSILEKNPEVPPILEKVILKLLSKDVEDRYSDGKVLVSDLERINKDLKEEIVTQEFPLGLAIYPGNRHIPIPFTGRNQEILTLSNAFSQACEGHGQVCIISGDSGIGKTHIVENFQENVIKNEGIFISSNNHELDRKEPFQGVIAAAERFFDIISLLPEEKSHNLTENLNRRLGHSGQLIQETIPGIRQYLTETQKIENLTDHAEKRRFDNVLIQTFLTLADTVNGVVLFIDNIQWADLGTLQFIKNFIPFARKNNILLIANLRTPLSENTQQSPLIKEIIQDSRISKLILPPLTKNHLNTILENLIQNNPEKKENICEAVMKKTGGNIQFIKEILQILNKKGFFEDSKSFNPEELDKLKISESQMEMIKSSILNFPPQTKKLFSYMAVMGRIVMLSDLFECFNEINRDEFIEAINTGSKAEVIYIKENTLTFTHGSFQKIFYNETAPEEIKKIHERVAEFHESREEPNIFFLAHNYSKTDRWEKALHYLIQAGQESLRERSYTDALSWFTQAEQYSEVCSDNQKRDILQGMGYCYSYLGQAREARGKLLEVLEYSNDPGWKSDILSRIADGYISEGSYSQAVENLKKAYYMLGRKMPNNVTRHIPVELIKHQLHIKRKGRFAPKENLKNRMMILKRIKILERLDFIGFWTGDTTSMMYNHFKSMNISRGLGATPETLRLLCIHIAILVSFPLPHPQFQMIKKNIPFYLREASKIYDQIEGVHPSKLLFKAVEAANLLFNEGDVQNSLTIIRNVMKKFWHERTVFFLQEITSIYSQILEAANEFDELIELGNKTEELAEIFENPVFHSYAATYRGTGLLFKGDTIEALSLLKTACQDFLEKNDKVFYAIAGKYLIKALYDTGEYNSGAQLYNDLNIFLKNHKLSHPAFCGMHHFFIEAEALRLTQKGFSSKRDRKTINRALSKLLNDAHCFDYVKTYYLTSALIYYSAVGKRSDADRIFSEGMHYFQYRKEPYRKGLFYLNRSYFAKDKLKEEYLKKAYLLFHHCNAKREMTTVEQFLDKEDSSLVREENPALMENYLISDMKTNRELDLILDIGKKIGSIHDLETLMSEILRQGLELVGAEQGEIIIEEEGKLNSITSVKINQKEDIPVCKGVLSLVKEKKETVLIPNAAQDPVFKHDADVITYQLKSILCTPMIISDKFLGMIYLGNRQIGNLFSGHQTELIKALAGEASIAVENALLLKKTRELQLRLTHIINSIPSGIIAVDNSGRVVQHNTLIYDLKLDRNHRKLSGSLFWEALPLLKSCRDAFYSVISNESLQEEIEIRYEDKIFTVAINPLQGDGMEGAVIKLSDVTESRKQQDHLVQIQKMETVSTMVGGLAHDFNNTLTGISASAHYLNSFVLNREKPDTEEIRESLTTIGEAVKRASNLVNQLLTFSMRKETELQPINICDVINHTLNISKRSFDNRISFSIDMPEEKAVILADADQLEQVLLNIMINASHAMTIMRKKRENWGGTLKISFSSVNIQKESPQIFSLEEGQYWKLSIEDDGVGMDKKIREKIFEPFFTTKRSGEGTGLGLSMAYSIMKRVNGFLDVTSEPGKGSTFDLYFPVQNDRELPEELKTPEDIELYGNQTLLIAEDENILRAAISKSLEACGFTVLQATNGKEAVDIFRENYNQIDLVIMDMVMPEMTGQEAYFAMKEIKKDFEIMLTSGFRKDSRVEELLNSGIDYFLQKPYTKNELFAFIKRVLSKKTAGR